MKTSTLEQYVQWLDAASELIDRIYTACEAKTSCTRLCKQLVLKHSCSELDKWKRELTQKARENGEPYRYDLNILAAYFQKSKIPKLKIGCDDFIPRIIATQKQVQPELLLIYPQLIQAVEQLQSLIHPDLCGDYPALERYIEEVLIPVDPREAESVNYARFDIQRFRKKFQETEIPEEDIIEFYMRKKDLFLAMEEVANQYGLYKKEYDPHFAEWCDLEIESWRQRMQIRQPIHPKIPWQGSATDLAALMERLDEADYIQAPTKNNGSVHAQAFADLIWACFALGDLKPESILQALKTKKQSSKSKFGQYLDTLPDREK